MNVLVTGGQGFLGRHMAGRLRGRVFTLDRSPGGLRAELSDPRQVLAALRRARPGVVYHLAGATHAPWPELWDAHVLATYGLLEAVRSLPPPARPRVVSAGSVHERAPKDPYGWSKLFQTRLCRLYSALGVEVVVARLSNLVGPGLPEGHALSSFCRQAALIEAGRLEALTARGNLAAGRDFLDVRDACRALELLARKGEAGQAYDVCSGKTTRVVDALRLLRRLAKVPFRIRQEGRPARADRIRVSPARLKTLTGWKPEFTLEESLSALLDDWR